MCEHCISTKLIQPFVWVSLLFLVSTAGAAVLKGTAYDWSTLEPLPGVVVSVNTTPAQQAILGNGTYSLFLPPGRYTLAAEYNRNGGYYFDSQNITIAGDGEYTLDLAMFPQLEVFDEDFEVEDSDEIGPFLDVEIQKTKPVNGWDLFIIVVIVAVTIITLLAYLIIRKPKSAPFGTLPDDLQRVIKILESEGGRMSQLDLRAKLPYSEAKVSLMLSDLEDRGVVERFKRGRGNIVRLKKVCGYSP